MLLVPNGCKKQRRRGMALEISSFDWNGWQHANFAVKSDVQMRYERAQVPVILLQT